MKLLSWAFTDKATGSHTIYIPTDDSARLVDTKLFLHCVRGSEDLGAIVDPWGRDNRRAHDSDAIEEDALKMQHWFVFRSCQRDKVDSRHACVSCIIIPEHGALERKISSRGRLMAHPIYGLAR